MKKTIVFVFALVASLASFAQHKGLDFNLDLGYEIPTKGSGGAATAEFAIGKRFTENFYWGVGSGVFVQTGDRNDSSIPVFTAVKFLFPQQSSSITPGLKLTGGYVFWTGGGKSENILVQLMPTVEFSLSKKFTLNVGVGYSHYIPQGGGDSYGGINATVGIGF